jgi:7,8-didemethyl-8-hydroxy-5-deazariboflavin synthase CofG subunit
MSQRCSLDSTLKEILHRALLDSPPTRGEAYQLINTGVEDLPAIMSCASTIRNTKKGHLISYSKKVFIPLTNMCRNNCGYCGFRRGPEDPASKMMMPDEVIKLAKMAVKAGCREALFVLGEKPEIAHLKAMKKLGSLGYSSTADYLHDICKMILNETALLPHSNLGILSREELVSLKDVNASMGLMLESSSARLCDKGGPHQHSPGKRPNLRLKTIEEAGRLKIPMTTGILIGIGETPEERIDSLYDLKRIHDRYNHIQEVIIQNFRAQTQTPMENNAEPDLSEIARTVAVARIIFQGKTNIQAPPNLIPGNYQMMLDAGINDWGGISDVTHDLVNPRSPWPKVEELRKATNAAGFQLRMRLPIYPEYIKQMHGYLPKSLENKIMSQVDTEGYALEESI